MGGLWAAAGADGGLLDDALPHRDAPAAALVAGAPAAPTAEDAVPVAGLGVAGLSLLRALARLAPVRRGHLDVPRALPHAPAAPCGWEL